MVGEMMRAAVLHGPSDLRVESRPVPAPAAGDVVVAVSHCGVCGTDLHMVVEGWGRPGSVGGHEWSGTIVAIGCEASDRRIGERVVGGPPPGCGRCAPCRRRRPSLCEARETGGAQGRDGAFAEYVAVPAAQAVPVPNGLDLRRAAIAEPLAVALHAVSRAEVTRRDRVLVVGAGPIGALVVVALRARGIDDVVVCEPRPARRAIATALGAAVIAPEDLAVPSIAEPQRLAAAPVDAVIECSGRAEAAGAGLAQLARGGRLVLVGTGIEPLRLDPNRILLNELCVTGAYEYDDGGIGEALDLLAAGLDVAPLLTEADVELDELGAAMVDLTEGRIAGKVLAVPHPPIPEVP